MSKVCAVVILSVAACGGTTKKADIGGQPAASDDVTAALFEQGKSWTFALATKTTPPVDTGAPTTVANGNLTCRIDSVRTVGAASVAKMSCAGAIDSAPTMYWVRNSQGLWGYYAGIEAAELAKQLANPNPKEMLLAAAPAAHETEIKDGEGANALYVRRATIRAYRSVKRELGRCSISPSCLLMCQRIQVRSSTAVTRTMCPYTIARVARVG